MEHPRKERRLTMPDINTIENLRQWFRTCPAIVNRNRFNVDYLGEKPTEYSIYSVPSTFVWKQNVLGESVLADIQTVDYIFSARLPFGSDVKQNMENLGFCEDVAAWIREQNNAHVSPTINEGTVKRINPTLTPYPVDMDEATAIYQIRLEMTYKRKE